MNSTITEGGRNSSTVEAGSPGNVDGLPSHDKDLEKIFNKYATRKTHIIGLFDLSLIITNLTQLKQTIQKYDKVPKWKDLDIFLTTFISLSIMLQIIIIVILVNLAMKDQFIDDKERKKLTMKNDLTILLTVIVSIINIVINVFINV